jgi:hypothetical protein
LAAKDYGKWDYAKKKPLGKKAPAIQSPRKKNTEKKAPEKTFIVA